MFFETGCLAEAETGNSAGLAAQQALGILLVLPSLALELKSHTPMPSFFTWVPEEPNSQQAVYWLSHLPGP